MDPNKFYCRNATTNQQSAASQSSISSASSSAAGICTGTGVSLSSTLASSQAYANCGSSNTAIAGSSCRDVRNSNNIGNSNNSKSQLSHRGTNTTSGLASGTSTTSGYANSSSGSGSGSSCGSSNGSGNNINGMPQPTGTLQYHRRKLTPQEYQSRLYYNTTDYRCREDNYSLGGNGRMSTSSPSPSLQFQQQQQQQQQQHHQQTQPHQQQHQHQHHNQHQHQHQQQQQHQLQHHHQHQHPQQQQTQPQSQAQTQSYQHQHQSQQHHHHHHHHHQQQQQLPQQAHSHLHLHKSHQSTSTNTGNSNSNNSTTDCVDEVLNCSIVKGNSHVVAATQTHHSGGVNCEQAIAASSISSIVTQPAPMLYTVHRVVTTAQIQTAGGNAFASSSSVSSVVSAVRNEADCLAAAAAAAAAVAANSSNVSVAGNAGSVGGGGVASAVSGCMVTNNTLGVGSTFSNSNAESGGAVGGLRNSPGLSTNSSFPQHQQQHCHSTAEVQQSATTRISSNNYNNNPTTSSSNTTYSSGAKSSIPRPLQNVIPTCVYLMSRIAVHMEIEGTAQCPSQVMLAAALGCEELGIANKLLAQSIFGLWMTSALLEIQLKSHHRPYVVRVAWDRLLERFSTANPIQKKYDEPMIMLRRNVFFSKRDEEKIKDHRILELLYEEAKHNVLSGRYIMESVHSLMLGGIQARIELGPFNSHTHTTGFFRESQTRFLPQHVAKNSSWSWLPVSRKNSAEVKLLEQYKRVPQTATTRKLMRKYLEFCWALPFYGAAFFHGQVEQPVRGLMSLVNHKDVAVIVAINERGIFIIDPVECTLLLGLRYEDLSWDFAKPSSTDDPDCMTCIFLQFDAVENGIQLSKLMQIFSKQAAMMDALIAHFAEQVRKRKEGLDGNATEEFHDEPNPIQNNGNGVLCNKLSRLTLATYDEEGRCIGQMGSLSISY